MAGSNEMEVTLSHVQKHMMDTCSKHGLLEFKNEINFDVFVLNQTSLPYLFGWKLSTQDADAFQANSYTC